MFWISKLKLHYKDTQDIKMIRNDYCDQLDDNISAAVWSNVFLKDINHYPQTGCHWN